MKTLLKLLFIGISIICLIIFSIKKEAKTESYLKIEKQFLNIIDTGKVWLKNNL